MPLHVHVVFKKETFLNLIVITNYCYILVNIFNDFMDIFVDIKYLKIYQDDSRLNHSLLACLQLIIYQEWFA